MAKGFEDTALYVYARLVSLNEVGGEPTKFGRPPAEIHHYFESRGQEYPAAMSPLSTHDTKRSEDMRARIDVLSEIPDAWAARVAQWMELNRPHKIDVGDGQLALDANEEYFLYQTLVGAWPLAGLRAENRAEFIGRIQAYLNKALHEAKVHTSWINPSPEYDAAAAEFVARVLDPAKAGAFLADFEPFQRTISHWGMFNSLAQTLLRCTVPGVPDTYQGTELWDYSLVDPDNRRPVDYDLRARLLNEMDRQAREDASGLARDLVARKEDGRVKLYVLSRALRFRRNHSDLFAGGAYLSAEAVGPRAGHAFCFARRNGEACALVVVPRLIATLSPAADRPPVGPVVWGETSLRLPDELGRLRWADVLTGQVHEPAAGRGLSVGRLLDSFPVALLEGRR
jgi:(1->4)-alpha-D-glucan 1-alpha-D-glucosylmutase